MRFLSISLLAVATVDLVASRALPQAHIVQERRDVGSTRWTKRSRVASDLTVPVRIGLSQSKDALEKAQSWLMDVSHPSSKKYGQHWTQKEVIEAFAPADDTVSAVRDWVMSVLGDKKQITHTENKAWLAFDASIKEVESLLHAEFHEHHDMTGERAMIACDQYHIPEHLRDHIDYITPGVKGVHVETKELKKRSLVRRGRKGGHHGPGGHGAQPPLMHHPSHMMPRNNSELSTCDIAITPKCLQALYHFEPLNPHEPVCANNSIGIFEEGDYYSQTDLNLFFANFTSYIPNGTHPVLDSVDGGEAPVVVSLAGGESDLDFELAIPIVYPQTVTLYQTDDIHYALMNSGDSATGIFNTFLDAIDGSYCTYSAYGETGNSPTLDPIYPDNSTGGYAGQLMCGVYEPTKVISISYGEQEQDLPAYYQKRQCNEFLKLGLQGTSIFVASGDTGVGGIPGDGTKNGCLRNGTVFSPTQPNSCPWLTNVGATEVFPGHTVFEPESAANAPSEHYSSSGGFSNIFPIPDYQTSAIAAYFQDYNPPYPYYYNRQYNGTNGLYNRNGRGIPDVAANGQNIAVYVGGRFGLEGGTSAASPIFASLVTRINEERIKAGKGSVGFINPVLYEHPDVLNDIVNGTNPGCGTQGFSCSPGWDPVTGLGTPNYPKMLSLFLSLD